MKWLLYNALFAVAYAAMLPSFLLRMKRRGGYRARFSDRFGRYPKEVLSALCLVPGEGSETEAPKAPSTKHHALSTKHHALSTKRIWIHAVSVGEVQVAGQLMRAMRERDPGIRFVFSTTSSTGWKTAEREVTPADVLIYNPLDFGGCVRRALDAINPRAVILTETEIWPNFIRALKKRGVPIYLVNARISDRSAPRYKALRWFFGEVFRCFTKIYAQSDLDAARLTDAGADPATVAVTGSFKFDVAHRNESKEKELREWAGDGEILLGGSTWPGEDVVMLEAYKGILERHPGVKLVIAPRHFEKADAVEANIKSAGFACVRRSRGDEPAPGAVYLADTTGELMGLFGISSVAFVGKSLCEHGSQNMIEPCLCGVATVVGPYTENFRPVMSDLLAADALVQTPDAASPEERAASVKAELLRFFDDPGRRAAYGKRAQAAVERRCGVVGRCADELLEALARKGFNAVPARSSALLPAIAVAVAAVAAATGLSLWWFSRPGAKSAPAATDSVEGERKIERRADADFPEGGVTTMDARPVDTGYRFRHVRLYPGCIAMLLHPGAKTVRVEGAEATFYRKPFETAGMSMLDGASGQAADILLVAPQPDWLTGTDFPGEGDWRRLAEKLAPGGNVALHIDTRRMSRGRLKGVLSEFQSAFGRYFLWCVGANDYVVTRATDVAADKLYDLFAGEKASEAFAEAGIYTPADVFACYMGRDAEIEPGLKDVGVSARETVTWKEARKSLSELPAKDASFIRPSTLTPYYIPPMPWFRQGDAESEVFAGTTNAIASVQVARREFLAGFDDIGGGVSTNAIERWAAAAKVSPRDPVLCGLVDVVDLKGRQFLRAGNVKGAMGCYEKLLLIRPDDAAIVHNYGVCIKRGGQPEYAAKVFSRAAELDPETDAHRIELVECCAASGHEDVAVRHLDVLIRKHPDDPALKLRAAKLLCLRNGKARNVDSAIRLAEEAAAQTGWKDSAYVLGLADVYIECGRVRDGVKLKRKMKDMKFDR